MSHDQSYTYGLSAQPDGSPARVGSSGASGCWACIGGEMRCRSYRHYGDALARNLGLHPVTLESMMDFMPPPTLKFRSFAEWPADTFTAADGSHVSTDDHYTEEAARAVCTMLLRHGFGGNGVRPVRVWVEDLRPNTINNQPSTLSPNSKTVANHAAIP